MANYDTPGLLYDSGVFYDAVPSPPTTRKKMAKPKLNLFKLTPEQTIQLANDIRAAMTGNPNFPTPIPTLTALGALITALQAKVNEFNAAQSTALMKTTERNAALDALRAALSQMSAYVQAASAGDEGKIQSAGMSIRGTPAPVGVPAQVMNLSVTAGDNEGELDHQWDPGTDVSGYEVQTSPDPITPNSWVNHPSVTRSRTTTTGHTSGQRIWSRVRAFGPAGPGPWSDPAVKTVP